MADESVSVPGKVELLVRGTLVNVLTGNLEQAAVAIDDGEIVAINERPAERVIETGYITPGLINAHMHIESSMVTLPWYGRAVIPHGVTAIVADPHEIANVLGEEGVRALVRDADSTPLKARFTIPSSVPASPLQHGGATLDETAVESLLDLSHVVGLAEVMNSTAVAEGADSIHSKIRAARERNLTVDGHLPRVSRSVLQEVARYIDTDHESITLNEAREKVDAGLRVFIREGSSSRNLEALTPLIDAVDTRRLSVCTDNFYPSDLTEHGGIGRIVARLIRDGYDPVEVVQMATLNTAECYDLPFGRVAPGAPADLVLLNDLDTWDVDKMVIDGVPDPLSNHMATVTDRWTSALDADSVSFDPLSRDDVAHPAHHGGGHRVRVVDHSCGEADRMVATVDERDGVLCADLDNDVLPFAVVERHGNGGGVGTGFVHGLGLKRGAIATTIAHDAHNVIIVGADHESMVRIGNSIQQSKGGIAVYDPTSDETTALALPIAGLMADRPVSDVATDLKEVDAAARKIGLSHADGVMLIDNLSLEVIPTYRLTYNGLVNVEKMEYVPIVVE